MKFFFNNPFTAPDIKDILRDRNMSFKNLAIVFCSGLVLASTLVGGYHIGQWFIGKAVPPSVPVQGEVSDEPNIPTVESRLAELGGEGEQGTYDVLEVARRTKELGGSKEVTAASNTPTMEDRLKELGG